MCADRGVRWACAMLVLVGCADEARTIDDGGKRTVEASIVNRYGVYRALAAYGGNQVWVDVAGVRRFEGDLDARMLEEIERQAIALPYIQGASAQDGHWWLQVDPTARENLVPRARLSPEQARILTDWRQGVYTAVWAYDVAIFAEGIPLMYTAWAAQRAVSPVEVDVLDPVVLGLEEMPDSVPVFHNLTGASQNSYWDGCEARIEVPMPQEGIRHRDSGSLYECWCDGTCATSAKGMIECDTEATTCPRKAGDTIPSGNCSESCDGSPSLLCYQGIGHSSMESKKDRQVDGNCQYNINVETWYGPASGEVTWKIKYTTPETPVGSVEIEWSGKTPKHSIYQTYILRMCCAREKKHVPTKACAPPPGGGLGDAIGRAAPCPVPAAYCREASLDDPAPGYSTASECEAALAGLPDPVCLCLEECGDGSCGTGETIAGCPSDCPPADGCGDLVCGAGEDLVTCPWDCGCGNDVCDPGEDDVSCPGDCYAGNTCGNGVCDAGEDGCACMPDCGACCGDGFCSNLAGEGCDDCADDCGDCAVPLPEETPATLY